MTDHRFPPLPVPGALIQDDPFWRYPSQALAGEGIAHLRLWDTAEGSPDRAGRPRLAVVSETGLGASITNSIEAIHTTITAAHGPRIVLLEHWPAGEEGEGEELLDQAVVVDGRAHWRRIWPTPPTSPDHHTFERWMRDHGRRVLAQTTT